MQVCISGRPAYMFLKIMLLLSVKWSCIFWRQHSSNQKCTRGLHIVSHWHLETATSKTLNIKQELLYKKPSSHSSNDHFTCFSLAVVCLFKRHPHEVTLFCLYLLFWLNFTKYALYSIYRVYKIWYKDYIIQHIVVSNNTKATENFKTKVVLGTTCVCENVCWWTYKA